ncbi:MAG TPA: CcoQ/FixQ family Cbb3-type cytochrome c oxidase assembly chaperone [Burkholderiales bacterium]|jgi:cytochrome c oxidase cbb3-type subunit 4
METIRSLMTLAAFSSFIGIVWWAYAPARRDRFEKDGLMPFDGEDQ